MPNRPRDPNCRCLWSPVTGRIWCDPCLTDGPLPGSIADPAVDDEAES